MGIQISGDPVPEGRDASGAPLEQASPDKAKPAPPGTGFPEPAEAEAPAPRRTSAPGHVTLATVAPVETLTVPPLDKGGKTVVITQDGTEVDEATAERAQQAAHAAGTTLREV